MVLCRPRYQSDTFRQRLEFLQFKEESSRQPGAHSRRTPSNRAGAEVCHSMFARATHGISAKSGGFLGWLGLNQPNFILNKVVTAVDKLFHQTPEWGVLYS
jgi:hypothetical protein